MSKKVLLIYNCFPHYRAAVNKELNNSEKYDFIFCASSEPHQQSIKLMDIPDDMDFIECKFSTWGPFLIQHGLGDAINSDDFAAVIFLGNPYIISYWYWSAYLKSKNIPVFFWTHGWINSREKGFKKIFRNAFYKLANGLLLYGSRAVEIGIANGFKPERLYAINNSLDYQGMRINFEHVKKQKREDVQQELGLSSEDFNIICSARLTALCKFDLLINAAHQLINKGYPVYVVLIGDGPVKTDLQQQAEQLGVKITFTGACYDELLIAKYYYAADLTVSPGKVGLTAMHSMTYETPVITHNNFDTQMPEFESIEPGLTGDFFQEDNANDLSTVIEKWINKISADADIPQKCNLRIKKSYSPAYQREMIEKALRDFNV